MESNHLGNKIIVLVERHLCGK